jgi:beta-mannosidase
VLREAGAGGLRRRTTFCVLAALCGALVAGPLLAATTTVPLDEGWRFRLDPGSVDASAHVDMQQWMPALVPGSVQASLLRLKKIPDPYWRITTPSIAWIGLSNWDYRKTFAVAPALLQQGHVELVFDGLDTFAAVSLNGKPIIDADNMFRTWKASVRGLLHPGANTLEVRFDSPIRKMIPIVEQQPYILKSPNPIRFGLITVPTAAYTRKAPYQYGWDWGPRVITEGIWQGVALRAWSDARVTGLHAIQQQVSATSAKIQTAFHVDTDGPVKGQVVVRWTAPDGRVTTASQPLDLPAGSHRVEVPVTLQHPELWWPAGYGAQPLYRFTATVEGPHGELAHAQATTGVRSVELRQQPDPWGTSFEFVVNGVPVFAKGANFVPTSVFPSAVTSADLDDILRSAHAANMNMLRIWGGGYYMPSAFYAEADKLGILLWQDFEFSDAFQPPWKSYHDNVQVEARQQVRRLRNHPSLVLWSGNNEVGEMWTSGFGGPKKPSDSYTAAQQKELAAGMDRLYNGVLKHAVERYAPGTPYVPMWPVGDEQIVNTQSRGNYHYWSVWHGPGLPATAYLGVTPRFMSEYGLQSFPSLPTIDSFTLPADRSAYSKVMLWHEKSEEDGKSSRSTIDRLFQYIERDYGKPANFGDAVYLSQVMQAEGIQLGAEHLRASAPRTMGSLFWQLDDDWPAISWSSIDYEHRWKMLQYHAKRFYAPVRVIALPGSAGARSIALSVANDTADVIHGTLRTLVIGLQGRVVRDASAPVTVAARGATQVGTDTFASLLGNADPASTVAVFELREGDRTLSRHVFEFVPPKDLHWVDPELKAAVTPDGHAVDVSARNFAGEVWITFGAHKVRLADNAFDLLPGEHVRVPIVQADAPSAALAGALHVESLYGAISREEGAVAAR